MSLFDDIADVKPAGGPAGADLFGDLPAAAEIVLDVSQPVEGVRAQIAALPPEHRAAALKAWAEDYVANERKDGGAGQKITDYVRQIARGTPVGSWLDEANARTSAGLYSATGGVMGAPFDEAVAYQRATDRAVDKETGLGGVGAKVVGGLASIPASAPLTIMRGTGALASGVNGAATGGFYGLLYGAGEGETVGDRAENAANMTAMGGAIGAPLGIAGQKVVDVYRRLKGGAPAAEAAPVAAQIEPEAATTARPAPARAVEATPEPAAQPVVRDAVPEATPPRDTIAEPVPAIETPTQSPAAQAEAVTAPAPMQPTTARDAVKVVTPDQAMEITATPEVVELSTLKAASGEFQPRDRSRAEYVQEARERANRLDPAQLGPSRVSDSGAPIVLDDGTIISGNGRTLSIQEVYGNPKLAEQAKAYRASLGPAAAGMKQPVLVMRANGLSGDDAVRFADLSNRGRIAAMSATERAQRDAKALGDGISLYQGGDFEAPHNADFMRHFMDKVVTRTERAGLSKDNQLTQEGAARMRNAVLAAAYDDAPTLARMLESTDDNIRNLTGSLTDVAPKFAAIRADIRAGTVMPEMDATADITNAVKLIADLRSRSVRPADFFAQKDAFGGTDAITEAWVRAFYNDDLSRALSRQKMTAVLNAYAEEAAKHQPGGLFADPTTAKDVLNVAQRAKNIDTEAAVAAEPSLFEAQGNVQGVSQGRAAVSGRETALGGNGPRDSGGRTGDQSQRLAAQKAERADAIAAYKAQHGKEPPTDWPISRIRSETKGGTR